MAGSTRTHRKKSPSKDPSFSKKKPLDFFPVQRKINIDPIALGPAGTEGFIDVGSVLSRNNRRLYRQGKMYSCKMDIDPTSLVAGSSVEVWVLKPTWATIRAWEMAKDNFDQSYIDERENVSKINQARWFDFRVDHGLGAAAREYVGVGDNNMTPAGGQQFVNGEFVLSTVEDQAGATRTFTWSSVGGATAYSIMGEYAEGQRAPSSPAFTTGEGPYDQLHADSSQIESAALQEDGNRAPYSGEIAQVGNWVKVGSLGMGATAGRFSTGFVDVPCGLIGLRLTGGLQHTNLGEGLTLEVQSGDYKGVRAHNMQRM